MQGYFLHLIVDYLFYHKYYPNCDTRVYNDYDILNEEFERWINDHKELDVVRKRIQKRVEMIDELRKKHIVRAFPDRKLSDQLNQLQDIVKKLTK